MSEVFSEIDNRAGVPQEVLSEFVLPALAAVPATLAARLGFCRITLASGLGEEISSRWSETPAGLHIELAADADPHSLALELLFCLGQHVWESASGAERAAWLQLLDAEIQAGVSGEIDEDVLAEKQRLLSSPVLSRSRRRLERYAALSFAVTLAEYIHVQWHDVTVRTGPEHLPQEWLRRRLALFERWFPPARPLFA